LNYGRIYGAGVPFAKQLLQTFNPALSELVSVSFYLYVRCSEKRRVEFISESWISSKRGTALLDGEQFEMMC